MVQNGVNGGRLTNNNRMVKAANNREIPDELRKISGTVPRAEYDDQNFNSMFENMGGSINMCYS